MAVKKCKGCGQNFHFSDGEEWKTVCIPCFKKNKEKARKETGEKPWTPPPPPPPPRYQNNQPAAIDKETLRRLIFLCHPDKHGGSNSALEATRWLLEYRDKHQK